MNVFLSTRHIVFTSQVDYLELFAKTRKINSHCYLKMKYLSLLLSSFLGISYGTMVKGPLRHLSFICLFQYLMKKSEFLILKKAANSKFHVFIVKNSTSNRQDHSNDPIFRFQISDLKTRKNFWKNALRRTNKKSQTSIKIKKSNKLTESENTSQTKSKAN